MAKASGGGGRGGGRGGGGGSGSGGGAAEIENAVAKAKEKAPSYRRSSPVGRAQQEVLDALGATGVESHAQATAVFEALGFAVAPQRVGRRSVPRIVPLASGGFNRYGEGVSFGRGMSSNVQRRLTRWMN